MRVDLILHPTDFSPTAAVAFDSACRMALQTGARLVLLHVHERPLGERDGSQEHDRLVLRGLEELVAKARTRGIAAVDRRLVHGQPCHVIVDVARELHCDLVVLGVRGFDSSRTLPIGRIAEDVTRTAPCSVLVVRPAPPEPLP